uniref:Uncharacterized protein n=1 Tax=Anguilla anguilla TaxID=7936 RepID=A0A0E9PYZ6_ANGAN
MCAYLLLSLSECKTVPSATSQTGERAF